MLHFQIQSIRDYKTTNVKANLLIIIIIKSKAYYNSVNGLYSENAATQVLIVA